MSQQSVRPPRKASNLFEEPAMLFLGRVFDIVAVNLLWLICSLPVVTLGASTGAMYYVLMKMARKDAIHVWKDFFCGFRLTWKRGTLSLLLVLPVLALAYLNVSFLMGNPLNLPSLGLVVFALPVLLALMVVSFLYPLLGFYSDRLRIALHNAFFLAISHLPTALLVTVLNLIPFVLLARSFELFLNLLLVWVFLAFGVIGYLNSKLLLRIFRKELADSDYPIEDYDTVTLNH